MNTDDLDVESHGDTLDGAESKDADDPGGNDHDEYVRAKRLPRKRCRKGTRDCESPRPR